MEFIQAEDEAKAVKTRLQEIRGILALEEIPYNQRKFCPQTIKKDVLEKRRVLVKELIDLEKKCIDFQILTEDKSKKWNGIMGAILIEVLGINNVALIEKEVRSRMNGAKHNTVAVKLNTRSSADIKEISKLQNTCNELKKQLLTARYSIDKYIRTNEPTINKADYLQSVREINICLPSSQELLKNKLK